jgi:uncharacterized protein
MKRLANTTPSRPFLLAAVLLLLLLSACDQRAAPAQSAQLPTAAAAAPTLEPANPAAVTIPPAATATIPPTATATPSPTASLTPSSTATPTATPTPTHPLMIEVMRQQAYPGSELTIEETLGPGANYDRYVTSYLSEGHRIYALLTVPWGQPPLTGWPIIIFNHGYIPPDEYRTTERYVDYVDGFARSGYIVFKSDYRGHGRSEGQPEGGYGSPAYTIDVLNGLAAVKRLPAADPDRIGMWGHSMGGHITLRAMVISGEIDAGVIWGGVVASYPDLLERWRRRAAESATAAAVAGTPTATADPANPRRRWRDLLAESYGTPAENPAFWDAISANSYLADLSGPLQLHHATTDASVPAEFSEICTTSSRRPGRRPSCTSTKATTTTSSPTSGRP